jgi:predicted dehydrogenase
MVHFIDLVHYITGAEAPFSVVTLGGTYRWKDARTAPDSVETILEYAKEGFLVRYCSTYGLATNSYLKFFGTRGTMDGTRWANPFLLSGEGSEEPDRLPPEGQVPEMDNPPHMKNWIDCMRSRQQPIAPIEAGYAHSVAVIMADESYASGRRMVYDERKRTVGPG